MDQFSFEKLQVWQLSRLLIKDLYYLTENFPDTEKFGLINQLRRAGISVASNIAEGNSRFSPKDKSHFTEIAYTSLMEVLNQLIISNDLGFIKDNELEKMKIAISELSNKLSAFYNQQRKMTKP